MDVKERLIIGFDGIAGLYALFALWAPSIWLYLKADQTGDSILMGLSVFSALIALYILVNYKRIFS